MESVLLRARELIESTVSLHRRTSGQDSLVMMAEDEAAIGNAVGMLLDRARHSVSLALPGNVENAKAGVLALDRLGAAGREDLTVRLLSTASALAGAAMRDAEIRIPRLETRLTEGELQEVLIADGRLVLVRSNHGPADDCVLIIEDPAAARALDLLFAGVWSGAVRPAEHARLHGRLRSDLARRILERMRDGCTDDVAAREVQVSLRTYRRHVAEIMRELGAKSRFQAGVRAVELGLLSAGD
ncbi:helix-turn-helix transcriptional regulator [Streptomyces cinnamoneus]|uniref:HTH luxR-type domain-containing protein n=1 Tax=Streptomyces cinnamoneus TaxID=53446 RepID=A0A918TW60_STRCJ|nr:DNA-binding response regulator [Streptomyces cinnamoneus]GHC63072.1 hypothetical protein GCM10010507_45370 [Streptomyces cinnamoneus]